jgi:hypothetical protein
VIILISIVLMISISYFVMKYIINRLKNMKRLCKEKKKHLSTEERIFEHEIRL